MAVVLLGPRLLPLARMARQQAKFFALTLSLVLWSTVFNNGASLTPSPNDLTTSLPFATVKSTNLTEQHPASLDSSKKNQTTDLSLSLETTGTCPQITTVALQSVTRPDWYTHQQKLSSFLKGPGLVEQNHNATESTTTSAAAAVCNFVSTSNSKHSSHALQQLYRCWSWWRTHPRRTAVLTGPSHYRGFRPVQRPDDLFTYLLEALQVALNNNTNDENVDENNGDSNKSQRFQIVPLSETNGGGGYSNGSLVVQPSFDDGDTFAMASPRHALELRTTLRSTYHPDHHINNNEDDGDSKRDWQTGCPVVRTIKPLSPRGSTAATNANDNNNTEGSNALVLPRIAILNRDAVASKRSLVNAADIAAALHRNLSLLALSSGGGGNTTTTANISVSVVHFENRTLAQQLLFWEEQDIVISPHGAQLVGLNFLPTCGGVLEVFPTGLYRPFYFGSLAEASGIAYATLYLTTMNDGRPDGKRDNAQAQATRSVRTGIQARQQNLCPNVESVVDATLRMVENWRACCAKYSTMEGLGRNLAPIERL